MANLTGSIGVPRVIIGYTHLIASIVYIYEIICNYGVYRARYWMRLLLSHHFSKFKMSHGDPEHL